MTKDVFTTKFVWGSSSRRYAGKAIFSEIRSSYTLDFKFFMEVVLSLDARKEVEQKPR